MKPGAGFFPGDRDEDESRDPRERGAWRDRRRKFFPLVPSALRFSVFETMGPRALPLWASEAGK